MVPAATSGASFFMTMRPDQHSMDCNGVGGTSKEQQKPETREVGISNFMIYASSSPFRGARERCSRTAADSGK